MPPTCPALVRRAASGMRSPDAPTPSRSHTRLTYMYKPSPSAASAAGASGRVVSELRVCELRVASSILICESVCPFVAGSSPTGGPRVSFVPR